MAFSAGVVPFSNVGYGLISDIEIEGREGQSYHKHLGVRGRFSLFTLD